LILFLCIGVTARELPEYMILDDDVSNDGDIAVYNLQPRLAVSSRADLADPRGTSAFGNLFLSPILLSLASSHASAPVGQVGADLLRLIEQQRC
jgi:hypothetical protein